MKNVHKMTFDLSGRRLIVLVVVANQYCTHIHWITMTMFVIDATIKTHIGQGRIDLKKKEAEG